MYNEIPEQEHKNASLGAGRAVPQSQARLSELLSLLDNVTDRMSGGLYSYESMNTNLLGPVPTAGLKGEDTVEPEGIISLLLIKAENLRNLCDKLDYQNQRLAEVVQQN